MKIRKGTNESSEVPVLLVTSILLVAGLAISSGLAKDTFGFLSQTGKDDFIENSIISNIKTACKTPGEQNIPRNTNFSYTLDGVEAIRIDYKKTPLDKFYHFELKYGPDNTQQFRIDKDGVLSKFDCDDHGSLPTSGIYQINGSLEGGLDPAGEGGDENADWISVDPNDPLKFRIMEEQADKWINVQVHQ